jgi:hypothetical protein
MVVSSAFWSGARREIVRPSDDCKKYLDGVFVFSKDPNYFVIRTDTAVIEMMNEPPKSYMVKYKVRWSANGCDHDLIFDRTTPRGLETTHKKGDFVHIQVKKCTDKQVSYTMTYKNKPPLEMVMYRVE